MEEFKEILVKENALLDALLERQSELHAAVRAKNWIGLEENIQAVQNLSDEFSALDERRETLSSAKGEFSEEEKSLLVGLHGKLLKSKIENQALGSYITATNNFVQGILDNAVPNRRNVLYSKSGIVQRGAESVVLNRIF